MASRLPIILSIEWKSALWMGVVDRQCGVALWQNYIIMLH